MEQAAHATNQIDQEIAVWVVDCMEAAQNWDEWDECAAVGGKVGRLREQAYALDLVEGRAAKRTALCTWLKTVHTLPDVPTVVVIKENRYRRCGRR